DGGEAAVLGAEGDDALGEDGADAGKLLELLRGRGVQVDPAAGGRGRSGGAGRGSARRGRLREVLLADQDLLAVGDLAGQVQRTGVGVRGQAARGVDRVGHPRPGREGDHPRFPDVPADVHGHFAARGRGSGTGGRGGGTARRRGGLRRGRRGRLGARGGGGLGD